MSKRGWFATVRGQGHPRSSAMSLVGLMSPFGREL